MNAVRAHVLHLSLARLKADVGEAEVEEVVAAFGRLGAIPGVVHLGAARASETGATHDLALFAHLRDRAALEVFGTDARHIDFLRRSLMGVVDGLVTADVANSVLPPERYAVALCFGAAFRAETFDWQIRELLDNVGAPLVVAGGPALDGRQRFRAAGVVFLRSGRTDLRRSGEAKAAFDGFRRRWDEAWGPIVTDASLVLGEARSLFAVARDEEKVS